MALRSCYDGVMVCSFFLALSLLDGAMTYAEHHPGDYVRTNGEPRTARWFSLPVDTRYRILMRSAWDHRIAE